MQSEVTVLVNKELIKEDEAVCQLQLAIMRLTPYGNYKESDNKEDKSEFQK